MVLSVLRNSSISQNISKRCIFSRLTFFTWIAQHVNYKYLHNIPNYIDSNDAETAKVLSKDMIVHENFLSVEEEQSLLTEIESFIKRIRYEYEHWDDAIHGYRETERKNWNTANQSILKRVRETSFPPDTPQIDFTHILDLKKDGYIKPHIDAVRFCGKTIAGICLLSPCIMRLVKDNDKTKFGDILLNQRSLYVMTGRARYNFTHEVLSEDQSIFKGKLVPRDRRISVICRNEPNKNIKES